MKIACLIALCVGTAVVPLAGQGTKTRPSPADYPAHHETGRITIAAENVGHSIVTDDGALFASDYIAIDVAVFAKDRSYLEVATGNFSLRINGRKIPLLPQAPGLVAASIKYDDWEQRPRLVGGGGMGDVGVVLGAPAPRERFPGDRTGTSRLPRPPQVDTDNPNVPDKAPVPIEEVVQRSSLPTGTQLVAPFSGLIYFPYKGKLAKIKSLELLYAGPYGETALRLP